MTLEHATTTSRRTWSRARSGKRKAPHDTGVATGAAVAVAVSRALAPTPSTHTDDGEISQSFPPPPAPNVAVQLDICAPRFLISHMAVVQNTLAAEISSRVRNMRMVLRQMRERAQDPRRHDVFSNESFCPLGECAVLKVACTKR